MVKPFLFREEREAERNPRGFAPGGCVRESDGNVFRRKPTNCRFCQPNSVLGDHDFPSDFQICEHSRRNFRIESEPVIQFGFRY